jgi:uncharacterized protein (TIGR03437 family)
MKRFCILVCLLGCAALKANQADAYVFVPTASGSNVKWNLAVNSGVVQNGRVVYSLNPAGSDNLPFAEVEKAITSSFKAWEDLPNSTIAFTRGPNSSTRGTSADNLFQIYWVESASDPDYATISGALGVTFLTYRTTGEIIDASLILNGVEDCWATNGRGDCLDVAEIATHEIGHSFGLAHSAVGDATMFPRTGYGTMRSRTLASDDAIAAAALYPVSDFSARTGVLAGTVRDGGGAPIFAANVVASDRNGNVIAAALSQPNGAYRIAGLPPGDYAVFAEPIDGFQAITFYGLDDLSSFYDNATLNFLTTGDQSATIRANGETALHFTVTRGTPAFNPTLVYLPGTQGSFFNIGAAVNAGTSTVVGIGGPGLPTTGNPLTISGSGITVTRTRMGTFSDGSAQYIVLDITIAANAAPGARTFFVSNGSQRAALAGALEIISSGAPPMPTLSVVSAANYTAPIAQESVASVFGTNLASVTQTARTNPLPTELGGVKVMVRDSAGHERLAPLFFVSPTQLNYQIPPNTPSGSVSVTFLNNGNQTGQSAPMLERVAPGLFAINGTGRGPAAGVLLRQRSTGQQVYEVLTIYTGSPAQWQTTPVDWSNATDRLFLVLFGTGIRYRSALTSVTATVGGRGQSVLYAGAQGSLVGIDQVNIQLNRADVLGRGELDVLLNVEGKPTNVVRVRFR